MLTSYYQVESVEVEPDLPKFGTVPKQPTIHPIVKLAYESTPDDPFCTAFVIDANYALTAAHCLTNERGRLNKETLKILNEKDEVVTEAKAVGANNRMDVGLIKGDFNKFQIFLVDFYNFPLMSRAGKYLTCGYPYGQRHLTCVPFIPVQNTYFDISGKGYIVPGMSGGPMIDVANNIVLGVNVSVGPGLVNVASVIGVLGAFGIEP